MNNLINHIKEHGLYAKYDGNEDLSIPECDVVARETNIARTVILGKYYKAVEDENI